MKKAAIIALSFLFVLSGLAVLVPGQAHGASTSTTIQYVKAAWGNQSGQVVFGERIGITNATYLGSLNISGKEVAYYYLDNGGHYPTNTTPAEKTLNWSAVKSISQVKLENFNVPTGNNYTAIKFGNATKVFSSSDEIEGMEIIGNYVYITYDRSTSNIEMRYLSNFTLIKNATIGNSTYDHVGGIVQDKDGNLWTVLGQGTDAGPAYVYEFSKNLTILNHFETDNDHYGTVFYAGNGVVILGNWNSQDLSEFNTTTHSLVWKVATPLPFQYTQDSAYLGNGYYLGARYRNNLNYSGIYLYHWNGTNISFDTNLLAYSLTGGNPIAVDSSGYVYATTGSNAIYKTRDVFLPLLYANITSGDKYNLGFSDVWPCQDSGHEQYTIGGTGSDEDIAFEMSSGGTVLRSPVVNSTTGTFEWAYYGVYADVNGMNEKGGLPTSAALEEIGGQTWGSATQSLVGSVYLAEAVPYIVLTKTITDSNSSNGTTGGSGFPVPGGNGTEITQTVHAFGVDVPVWTFLAVAGLVGIAAVALRRRR